MPNHPLTLRKHLTPKQIKQRYISCTDAVERSHWQAIFLLSRLEDPLTAEKAAAVIGCTPNWVRKLAHRYNKSGAEGLADGRKHNGNKPMLKPAQQRRLKNVLVKRPPDGGLWNGPKVARWMNAELKTTVSAVTGWHYLKRLDLSLQVPRPRNGKAASPKEEKAFKKNFMRG